MCGLCGIIYRDIQSSGALNIKNMCDSIKHRGPDDAGYVFINTNSFDFLEYTDPEFTYHGSLPEISEEESQKRSKKMKWNIVLGHRRLSIVDLSKGAHQPMSDHSRNFWIIFNGEIYNFRRIKSELSDYKFLSSSDTEVVLYSYIKWGMDFVNKIKGMFAMAILDLKSKRLHLIRDGYGMKPLYYMITDKFFAFGSEIKAILSVLDRYEIDVEAVYEYFTFQNLLTHRTFFRGIYLVPPGTVLSIDLNNMSLSDMKYWDFHFHSEYSKSFEWYKGRILDLFEKSVLTTATHGDVECGSYLSGGIDTGAIVSVYSKYLERIKTFTVGFDTRRSSGIERAFDEREKAEYMSWKFNTEHYEIVLKEGDLEASIDDVVWHLEEPRLGQSYPNYYASKLAGRFVKSVLSGAGGDELFGGYPWRYLRVMSASNFEDFVYEYYKYWSNRIIHNNRRKRMFNIKNHIPDTYEIFKNVFMSSKFELYNEHPVDLAFYFDSKVFLHGVLMIEDKFGMAFGLETRFPFLCDDLVNVAQKIPWSFKLRSLFNETDENDIGSKEQFYIRTNSGKFILRSAFERFIPEDILWGIKQGFSTPDSNWFRGKSMDFIKKIIKNPHILLKELLNMNEVSSLINDHLNGRKNHRLFLWSFIYFHKFLEKFFR